MTGEYSCVLPAVTFKCIIVITTLHAERQCRQNNTLSRRRIRLLAGRSVLFTCARRAGVDPLVPKPNVDLGAVAWLGAPVILVEQAIHSMAISFGPVKTKASCEL